jgi:tetratricopeptide (TPR) repeat protein
MASAQVAPAAVEAPAEVDSLLAGAERALEADDVDLAEALYARALSASDDDHRAEHGLARVGIHRGDHDAVISHARRAIKRDKKNSGYHMTLARGYGMKAMEGGLTSAFYAGKYKSECKLAIEYDPRNIDAHMGLLQFYVMAPGLMGGSLEKAEETAERVAALDPFIGRLAAGFVAWQSDDLEGAEREYVAAARIDTLDTEGWKALARFYTEVGRYGEAIALGDRILALDPGEVSAVYQRARAYLLQGEDLEAAEAGFRRYIESDERPGQPTLASAYWRLGQVYEKGGDLDSARREWERAVELAPEHRQANADLDTLRLTHPELW